MVMRNKISIENTPTEDLTDFLKKAAESVNKSLKRDSNIIIGNDVTGGDTDVPYWVRTYIPALDYAIGGFIHPGVPVSRIIEIHGSESVGKTTLALWITKCTIEQLNALALYQDAEHVLTQEIIKGTQIDMNHVMLDDPAILEDVFDFQEKIIEQLAPRGLPIVTVLDSIAACSTQNEIEGDMESHSMGEHARLMSKGLRKIKSIISENKVLSLWINQTREKMGLTFGDNTATFAGKAMNFYASARIRLSKSATLKKDGSNAPYGVTITASVIKNKVAPPLRKAEYNILFIQDEHGSYPRIDIEGALVSWCKEYGFVKSSTGWLNYEGKNYRESELAQLLRTNPEVKQKL